MMDLNLPSFPFKVLRKEGKLVIFDPIRKKYLSLTPEEWVRQHFIRYLIEYYDYPRALIRTEMGLQYNQMARRSDIVVYGRDGLPCMIVECKAPDVRICRDTFEQVAAYNKVLKARYLVVTNGINHFCCAIDFEKNRYEFLKEIPQYEVAEKARANYS